MRSLKIRKEDFINWYGNDPVVAEGLGNEVLEDLKTVGRFELAISDLVLGYIPVRIVLNKEVLTDDEKESGEIKEPDLKNAEWL